MNPRRRWVAGLACGVSLQHLSHGDVTYPVDDSAINSSSGKLLRGPFLECIAVLMRRRGCQREDLVDLIRCKVGPWSTLRTAFLSRDPLKPVGVELSNPLLDVCRV